MRKEWGKQKSTRKIIIRSMDNYYWSRRQNIVDQKLMNFRELWVKKIINMMPRKISEKNDFEKEC